MSILRALFGPSKEEVWRELSRQLDADFIAGGFFRADKVQARVEDWIITLDTYTVSTGKVTITYTRLRAPFVNQDGFRFTVYRAGLFSELGKGLLGMQDIEVDQPVFDRDFIIKGNNTDLVRELFANYRLRQLIQAQPRIHLEVKDDEGWFGADFPEGVDELYFQVAEVIKDVGRLRLLFDLFAEALQQLCHLGSAYQDDVDLHIEKLLAPGGRVESEVVLWEGDPPRHRAAEELERLKDPRGVVALMAVLDDADLALRAKAVRALGEIGDPRATPALLPLLGVPAETGGRTLSEWAGQALGRLGEGERVEAFHRALQGNAAAVRALGETCRREMIQALINALRHQLSHAAARVARALADLGAVEALPHLRARRASYVPRSGEERQVYEQAIADLEALAALPRPAEATPAATETLPRPAGAPGPDTGTLPRPAEEEGEG